MVSDYERDIIEAMNVFIFITFVKCENDLM